MSEKLTDLLRHAAASRDASAPAKRGRQGAAGKGAKQEPGLYKRLADVYERMEKAYEASARQAGLSCAGCETNCCTSFFQHHTHVEWAYLWRGMHEVPEKQRKQFIERAKHYLEEARAAVARQVRPTAMCPLNEDGLCALYPYRLMICRMHGTRNVFTRPDGQRQIFPGCVRFTALPCAEDENACPSLDRTPFYNELAALELAFREKAGRPLPRVDLTLAEMLVLGPPKIR